MSEGFGLSTVGDMVVRTVTDMTSAIVAFTPKLIGAVLVLVAGWLLSRLIEFIFERALSKVGLDGTLERLGFSETLSSSGLRLPPSKILGRVLFWLVMLIFILGAADILGLSAVKSTITRLLGYLPSVISAAFVVVVGFLLARFVGNLVSSGAAAANISYASGLGAVCQGAMVVMVGVVTVEQLGIDTQILITVITVMVAAIAFGMGLAFALGSQDVFRSILAGHYLRQSLPQGEVVEVSGQRGVLEQIGPLNSTLREGETTWIIPNTRLIEEIVKR